MYLPATELQVFVAPAAEDTKIPSVSARVLLVEDNATVASSTSELIRGLGCEVVTAASADEASALLARDPSRFDIVLSDIVMPGKMNGVGLARQMRERWPSLPVILMTGHAPEFEAAAVESNEVMRKPLQPEALARALARHVRPAR